MKKVVFTTALLFFAFLSAPAQTPQPQDTLQHYVGKYKFPEGSVVAEITVSVENGVLMASSVMGNAELKKIETDVFEIVGYGGTATFKRNSDGKVITVQIIVGDINMEGTKTELSIRLSR
jgi:restriction endonuclease Mrr